MADIMPHDDMAIWRFSASSAIKLICHVEYQWLPHTEGYGDFTKTKMNKHNQSIYPPTIATLCIYFTYSMH